MVEKELLDLYKKTKLRLNMLVDDLSFTNFYRALQSGKRTYVLKNSQIVKTIDEDWINAILKCIPHIDAIVSNPKRYMKREQEVVPIEKARFINSDSVIHLASHTNFINAVEDGFVQPSKILNNFNEDTLDMYENRFLMTLIIRVNQFIDRRYFLLGTGGFDFSSDIHIDGEFEQAGEDTEYTMSMRVHQGAEYFEGGISDKVYENLYTIRKYMVSFRYSGFMKIMSSYAQVRPPIMKTNILTKNPDYRACLELWNFIQKYDKTGYKIDITEYSPEIERDTINDFDAVTLLQYIMLKNKMYDFDSRTRPMAKVKKRTLKPTMREFEQTKDADIDSGAQARLMMSLEGGEQDRKRVEQAIKEILTRAIRKEQIKTQMAEREHKQLLDMVTKVMEKTLADEKLKKKLQEKERTRVLTDLVKGALGKEKARFEAKEKVRKQRERSITDVMRRAFRKVEKDDRLQLEIRQREEQEQNELIGGIISDSLKLENRRDFVREHPVTMFGNEYVPVPVSSGGLPASEELASKFSDMFAPPPPTDDEIMEMLVDAFNEFKGARKGPAIPQKKANAVEGAVKNAVEREKKRQRAREESEEKETSKLQKMLGGLLEQAQEEQEAPEPEPTMADNLVDAMDAVPQMPEMPAPQPAPQPEPMPQPMSDTIQEPTEKEPEPDSGYRPAARPPSTITSDVNHGFWWKFIRKLFFWWRRKR